MYNFLQSSGQILAYYKVKFTTKHNITPHVFASPMNPGAESKDYSALGTAEILTCLRRVPRFLPQTPDEVIGTLSAKNATKEVLKKVLTTFCTVCLCLFSWARLKGAKIKKKNR